MKLQQQTYLLHLKFTTTDLFVTSKLLFNLVSPTTSNESPKFTEETTLKLPTTDVLPCIYIVLSNCPGPVTLRL